MEILRLAGFAMMLIFVILAILTIKLIGFEIHQKEINQQLSMMDERLKLIETNDSCPYKNI